MLKLNQINPETKANEQSEKPAYRPVITPEMVRFAMLLCLMILIFLPAFATCDPGSPW